MPDEWQSSPDVLDHILTQSVADWGQRPAMNFLGRGWTYRELGALVERATRGLQDFGVGPGTRVGLCLPNTPYYVVFFYAALRAGATVVNFNPLYVERELATQIADSGTSVMVTLDLEAVYRRVANVAEASGLTQIIVCPMVGILPLAKAVLFRLLKRRDLATITADARTIPFAAVIRRSARSTPVAVRPADLAVLQYTGGTTGLPKGAMLSHANLTANCRQVCSHWPGGEMGRERVLAVLPFFHVFAMTSVLNYGIAMAAEIVMLPRFDLDTMLKTVVRRRITVMNAVPTIYTAVNTALTSGRVDLSSIRFSVSGGAPLPAEVREHFVARTGCKLVEGYGLSEASPVVSCNPPDGRVKPGSAGLGMAGTVIEIRDPTTGTLLPVGERGEICVRGPQVMAGYWNRPAETAAAFVDGALRTGDIGHLDEDGYLFLVDRIKDVILCGGYNVYPRVLEDALYEHPAVLEATVIGIPDAYRGEVPKAFVVLKPGMTATPDALQQHVAAYVSKIERPSVIEIRASLPKTLIGKLSKKELIAEHGGA